MLGALVSAAAGASVAAGLGGAGVLLSGCKSCGSQPAFVAKLADVQGTATRSGSGKGDAWSPAPTGATFVIGDALRTGASTSARVTLTAGGALKLGENTLVRFLLHADAAGGNGVGVETGEAEVETGSEALGVETPMGLARFEPGSRVKIRATANDARFDVMVGRADIEGDGGVTTVDSSQHIVVTWGNAVVEVGDGGPSGPPAPGIVLATPDAGAGAGDDAATAERAVAEIRGSGVRASIHGSGPLATLAEGRVDVADGSRFVVPDGATVSVSRGSDRATVMGHSEVVVGHAGGPLLESRSGQVVLTSPTAGTRIDVPGGSIVLTAVGPGTRQAEVRVDKQTTKITAEAGQVEIRGRLGAATVSAGESGTLDPKGAAQAESAPEPKVADLDVPAGESSTIHSPRGSAAVRIRIEGACDGDALVEVSAGRGKRSVFVHGGGPAAAVVALVAGTYGGRVRCVDAQGRPGDAKQTATLRVVRDNGAQAVPRTAPRDFVDADGRHYSVLYQNQLPQITMRWPRAPAGVKASVHVEGSSGAPQVLPAADGTTASAGALAEGSYKFWFQADGDPSTRSPETTLKVAFDNAAPAAELQQPVEGKATAGTVTVSGVAVEGASISVDGTPLPLDSAFRFKGDVTAGAGDPPNRSIAVRISHPSHGVNYYLRTIGGG
jgi:hypothetical protein